jgi:hypothetical protein
MLALPSRRSAICRKKKPKNSAQPSSKSRRAS